MYWKYDLNPHVFEIKNLNFAWVTTIWGIIGLVIFFGLGLFYSYKIYRKTTELKYYESIFINIFPFFSVVSCGLFIINRFGQNWNIEGLRWYSTMYIVGFASVLALMTRFIKQKKLFITEDQLANLIMYCFFGMFLGARTAYVFIYNWDDYKNNLMEIIKVWHGGLSFHGGTLGVVIGIILFAHKNKIPFFHLTDKGVIGVPIGIGFGRLGNFLNEGELFGRITDVSWGIIFPGGGPLPRHPSQLYQSFFEGWLLLFTLYLLSRKNRKEGTLSAAFVFFYGLYRFPMEYFREADKQLGYYFNDTLTMGQILCILFIIIGISMFFYTRNNLLEGSEAWKQKYNVKIN